eukprot:6590490-Alexandrium_andersonii.AAC.1
MILVGAPRAVAAVSAFTSGPYAWTGATTFREGASWKWFRPPRPRWRHWTGWRSGAAHRHPASRWPAVWPGSTSTP